jgi:outer membrane PBP1 activator LpoA protein
MVQHCFLKKNNLFTNQMIKRILTILVVGVLLVSCSNDKKVRAKLIGPLDNKKSSAIYLVEVDPMYRLGDTVYVNRNKYLIVK